jgi:parallel beta helix pectate lyase-like protein
MVKSMSIKRAALIVAIITCAHVYSTQGLSAENDAAADSPTVIHVAPNGADTGDGSHGAPLAAITAAQQKIREMKRSGGLPKGGVVVEMRGGRYEWAQPIDLTAADSGTAEAPIVYRARPGETVLISGGKTITDWKPVTDQAVLERLDPAAQGNVYQADLTALGVTEYGDLLHDAEWEVQWRHHKDDNQGEATRGDAEAARVVASRTGKKVEARLELFCNGKPMQISRWPNEGFTHIDKALGETKFDVRGLPGRREGIFSCVDDRPSRWTNEKDAMVRGYWFRDWVVQTQKIESIEPEGPIIHLAKPYHNYGGYRDGMWFFGFNMPCEIDTPGEWYIDRESGILYFWPPLEGARTEISVSDGLFSLTDTAHVTLRGLNLEAARGTAVRIKDSENCRIVACSIRNVTNYGVTIVDGKNCSVIGCDITGTGGGGVFMAGGDRHKLIPAGHAVENCHIHHFARWDRTYRPGILMTGAGLRASHNLIHDAPHSAIVYGGPLHRFDYNEIHNVCQESHDCGAIYGGRSWCMRGDVFEHNYLHHICGKDGGACNGIYLDDANSGTTVRGNVFHQVWRPVFIGGGRDTLVENNLFIDCPQAFHMDARYAPGNWAAQYGDPRIEKAKKEGVLPPNIRFREPPYSTRFPKLATILEDAPTFPKGNVLRGNVFWRGDGENLRRVNWENPPESKTWRQDEWWYHIQGSVYDLVTIENNLIDVNPKCLGEKAGNFQLRQDSPAWKMGFERIPFEKIGLYEDDSRASWPVEHPVTPLAEYGER